jgi:hypothetical protein
MSGSTCQSLLVGSPWRRSRQCGSTPQRYSWTTQPARASACGLCGPQAKDTLSRPTPPHRVGDPGGVGTSEARGGIVLARDNLLEPRSCSEAPRFALA